MAADAIAPTTTTTATTSTAAATDGVRSSEVDKTKPKVRANAAAHALALDVFGKFHCAADAVNKDTTVCKVAIPPAAASSTGARTAVKAAAPAEKPNEELLPPTHAPSILAAAKSAALSGPTGPRAANAGAAAATEVQADPDALLATTSKQAQALLKSDAAAGSVTVTNDPVKGPAAVADELYRTRFSRPDVVESLTKLVKSSTDPAIHPPGMTDKQLAAAVDTLAHRYANAYGQVMYNASIDPDQPNEVTTDKRTVPIISEDGMLSLGLRGASPDTVAARLAQPDIGLDPKQFDTVNATVMGTIQHSVNPHMSASARQDRIFTAANQLSAANVNIGGHDRFSPTPRALAASRDAYAVADDFNSVDSLPTGQVFDSGSYAGIIGTGGERAKYAEQQFQLNAAHTMSVSPGVIATFQAARNANTIANQTADRMHKLAVGQSVAIANRRTAGMAPGSLAGVPGARVVA